MEQACLEQICLSINICNKNIAVCEEQIRGDSMGKKYWYLCNYNSGGRLSSGCYLLWKITLCKERLSIHILTNGCGNPALEI